MDRSTRRVILDSERSRLQAVQAAEKSEPVKEKKPTPIARNWRYDARERVLKH